MSGHRAGANIPNGDIRRWPGLCRAAGTTMMMPTTRAALLVSLLASAAPLVGCVVEPAEDVGEDPGESAGKADGSTGLPDVRCASEPDLPRGAFVHTNSKVISLAEEHHRAFDLVAGSTDATQVLEGKLRYGLHDVLFDEEVDVLACSGGVWKTIATTVTDLDGVFHVELSGTKRLKRGLRDLYVSVQGDRTGARFVALVAPAGTKLAVSDVDGTLTESEDAFPKALVTGAPVALHAGAAAAFQRIRSRGFVPVYVTARGDIFTNKTRDWLVANGMPRGPMRLAADAVTLPGEPTVAFKSAAFAELADHGFAIGMGIGNRASDITAYTNAGVPARSIFIKLPEFEGEVADRIADGEAVGFPSYSAIAR